MSLLKNLSKEAVIRGVKIKNRIIMPAMGTGLADIEGQVTSEMINYYEERAIGGSVRINLQGIGEGATAGFPFVTAKVVCLPAW